jgi:dolichyl-phosphate-mannose-protein mannosyltransferase
MNILKRINSKHILIAILVITILLRLYRINYPNKYVFDEVYHAFTAKEFLVGHKEAWEWWTKPPPGVAYEWTHPPLAKEIMAASMYIFTSTDAWAWRLPGVLMGTLATLLVYLLGIKLLNKKSYALIATFVFSFDGLNFVQSRTGMNDIYYVTFALASLLFILNKKFFLSAILFGLAISSKWAAIYLVGMYMGMGFYYFILQKNKKNYITHNFIFLSKIFSYFIFIPPIIYLISYLPFFALGHSFNQFIQLQQQIWWYHTGLKATHNYSSPWWSWPLNLYPVWYFVDYQKNTVSNIFTSGNPILFWVGSVSILLTIIEFIKTKSRKLLFILLGFFTFWLPWSLSPRIMFLYHFSPSVPFLCLCLAQQLGPELDDKKRKFTVYILLLLIVLGFITIYPFLIGLPIPRNFINLFFITNLSKNPFI